MNHKRKSTIYDVANLSGVSPATVSRVLNHSGQVRHTTVQKVLAAMTELEFDAESHRERRRQGGLRDIRQKELLLILSVPDIHNEFYIDIIDGVQMAAQKHGHNLLINTRIITELSARSILSMLQFHNAAGLITTEPVPAGILGKIREYLPLVQCSEYNAETEDVSYVGIDDFQAGYKITKHLLGCGYTHIGFLTTPTRVYHYAVRRYQGYTKALIEAGLTPNPRWTLPLADINLEYSLPQIQNFLTTYPPQALIAVSDVFAAAAIKAAEAAGIRIPDELAVIGIDDTSVAKTTTPSITSLRQPRYQMGYTACEVLLEEILQPDCPSRKIYLDTDIIFRESAPAK